MQMLSPTNRQGSVIRQVILITAAIFFSLCSNAQEEEKKDSVIIDTTEQTVDPVEEGIGETEKTTDKEYFFKRWDTLSVRERTVPVTAIKKIKEDDAFWYADSDLKSTRSKEAVNNEKEKGIKGEKGKNGSSVKEQEETNSTYIPVTQRVWFQTILWFIIIAGFVSVLILYLRNSNIGLFRKKNKKTASGQEEDMITEDIFAINYQKEIERAAAEGNYRQATRLLFLRLLKIMSEKNIIRFKQDKTNLDYLLELYPTPYYKNFFRITRNYEYSWYGLFPVSKDAYLVIRNEFDGFEKELR